MLYDSWLFCAPALRYAANSRHHSLRQRWTRLFTRIVAHPNKIVHIFTWNQQIHQQCFSSMGLARGKFCIALLCGMYLIKFALFMNLSMFFITERKCRQGNSPGVHLRRWGPSLCRPFRFNDCMKCMLYTNHTGFGKRFLIPNDKGSDFFRFHKLKECVRISGI